MKSFFVILCALIVFIGDVECATTGRPGTPQTSRRTVAPTRTTPRTTTWRPADTCYFCQTCPRPFTASDRHVTRQYTPTGWCAKMSASSSSDENATRGPAPPGVCFRRGCSWQTVNFRLTWVCCCDQNLCNTGVSTSKSTISILSMALGLVMIVRKSI